MIPQVRGGAGAGPCAAGGPRPGLVSVSGPGLCRARAGRRRVGPPGRPWWLVLERGGQERRGQLARSGPGSVERRRYGGSDVQQRPLVGALRRQACCEWPIPRKGRTWRPDSISGQSTSGRNKEREADSEVGLAARPSSERGLRLGARVHWAHRRAWMHANTFTTHAPAAPRNRARDSCGSRECGSRSESDSESDFESELRVGLRSSGILTRPASLVGPGCQRVFRASGSLRVIHFGWPALLARL